MSHMTMESVGIVKRGLSILLSFSISCHKDYSSNIESEMYFTGDDDLAQFYLEFVYSKSNGTISPRIYSLTTSMRHNSSIIMSMKCENPKIFKEWVCGSEWAHLSLEPVQKFSCYNDTILYKFKIIVTVNKEKIEPFYAHVYEDEHFTDFNLVGVNGNVAVHKVVLAASSPVFKAMLLGKWKETTEATIKLPGIARETLQHLKEFMYLGVLPDKEPEPLRKETTESTIELPEIAWEIQHLKEFMYLGVLSDKELEPLRKETTESTIELPEIAWEIQHLKEFMYLGVLSDKELEPLRKETTEATIGLPEITREIEALLLLAKFYMMDNLKTKCIKKLIDAISCDNIYTFLEFACKNNLPELSAEILHFTSFYPEIAEKAYMNKTASPIPTPTQAEEERKQTNETGEGN